MLVDAVAVPSIKCNQCTLSMNNSNAWHDTKWPEMHIERVAACF